MFRKLCGESTLKNVVLVTNMWKEDSRAVNEAREKELSGRFFKPAIDKGAQMARHHNTVQSAHDIIRGIMKNHPLVLQIQRELVDEHKDIIDTAAGDSVNQELKAQIKRHQKELQELREEMNQALKAKDEEMRQEIEEAKRVLEGKIKEVERASDEMAANYAAEKAKTQARMEEMEHKMKQERARAKIEHARNSTIPTGRLQRTGNAATDSRAGWEQEIKKLQDRVVIPIYK